MKRSILAVAIALSATCTAAADAVPDLRWLQGAWCGSAGGTATVEYWLPPSAGTMLGLHQDVKEGRTTGFEFLRIEFGPAGTAYVAQPGGAPPTRFKLADATATSLRFEDPTHDFPKRVHYALTAPDTLSARVDDATDEGQALAWTWTRCDPATLSK